MRVTVLAVTEGPLQIIQNSLSFFFVKLYLLHNDAYKTRGGDIMGKDEILDKRSEYIQELFDDEVNYIDLMPGNFADFIPMKDQVGASIKLLPWRTKWAHPSSYYHEGPSGRIHQVIEGRKSCRVRPHKSGPTWGIRWMTLQINIWM